MDEYLHKKPSGGYSVSKQGSNIAFREQNHMDRSIQNCSRLGCSTKHNSLAGPQSGMPEKPKYTRSPRPMSCKTIAGNSSRSFPGSTSFRRSFHESQYQVSPRQPTLAESSNRQEDVEDMNDNRWVTTIEAFDSDAQLEGKEEPEPIPATIEGIGYGFHQEISTAITESSGSCNSASSSKPRKQTNGKLLANHTAASSSFLRRSSTAHRNTSHVARPSQVLVNRAQKYGLKNFSCTSITDVLPSGCSSSMFVRDKSIDMVIRRPSSGESSNAKGKAPNASVGGVSSHAGSSSRSLTITESTTQQQDSRRNRNRPATRGNPVSVRTHMDYRPESHVRLSRQGGDNTVPIHEPITIPQLQQTLFSNLERNPINSSRTFTMESPNRFHNSFEQADSSLWSSRRRSAVDHEDSSTQTLVGSSEDRDRYRRFNMQGVAEVLLALERIGQDEELSYEQLLMLETSLFSGGINFHDQHRDMRMDIDNMSYEELLVLQEKMGTVSTALSEEQLLKYIKKSRYMPASVVSEINVHKEDDIKCSICQEEYVDGDEMGKLSCQHQYHVGCIEQWLRQKNWCPICKSSALSS